MINVMIKDISDIVDSLNTVMDIDTLVLKLDAEVKWYLHQAFLDAKIFDYTCSISKFPLGVSLNVTIQETHISTIEYLTFDIDCVDSHAGTDEAYDRAMGVV